MSIPYDDDEIPLALVRRAPARRVRASGRAGGSNQAVSFEEWSRDDEPAEALDVPAPEADPFARDDRMSPAMAGGLMGFLAGAVGFGVVHLAEPARIAGGVGRAASQWALSPEASLAIAYGTTAAAGALVGAAFAAVTQHLRRFFPLVLWAVIFFVSLTLLLLAVSRTYGNGLGVAMAPAILGAAAAYGLVASFELPLRRRAR